MPMTLQTNTELISLLQERIRDLEFRLEEIQLHTHILLEIAKTLNASLDTRVIASNIINAIVSLIAINKASVLLYNKEKEHFEVLGVFDSSSISPSFPQLDFSIPKSVLFEGKTYTSNTSSEDWGWVCCLPLQNNQHKIGTINIHSIRQKEITKEQLEFLETVAGHASSALENALLYAIVERESITDGLTGVYNHKYFQKRLKEYISLCQRRKHHSSLGLVIMDVDFFKSFNDKYGHPFGDTVLKTVVQVLTKHLREEDLLARYGGEEFVLIIPDATEKIILAISEKIRHIVEYTKIIYPSTGEQVSITVSIGSTLWKPYDSVSTFVARADNALYRAKSLGRNQSLFLLN